MDKEFTWKEMQDAEAVALSRGEFQGMVMQALKDLKKDNDDLYKILNGNGQPGLIQRMNNIDKKLAYWGGGIAVIMATIDIYLRFTLH